MTIIAVLIAIGSLLIFAETLLMMGVLFAIAVCMFAVAGAVAFSKFGALSAMGVGGAFIAVCVFAMLVWSKVIPKTKFAKEIYLKNPTDSKAPSQNASWCVGREATAKTPLCPSGIVEIDGHCFDAYCEDGHCPAGEKVSVASATSFELKVRKNQNK